MSEPTLARDIRVGVIDDDAAFRRLCQTILRSEGFECEVIEDLDGVVDQISASLPDVILMDLRLGPDRDAVGLLEALSLEDGATAHIPILICTASADLINLHRPFLDRLSCEIVEKPFDIDVLLAALERCLQRIQRAGSAD